MSAAPPPPPSPNPNSVHRQGWIGAGSSVGLGLGRAASVTPPPSSLGLTPLAPSVLGVPSSQGGSNNTATSSSTKEMLSMRQECQRLEQLANKYQNQCGLLELRLKDVTAKLGDFEQQRAATNRAKLDADEKSKAAKRADEKSRELIERAHALENALEEEKKMSQQMRSAADMTVQKWKERLAQSEHDAQKLRDDIEGLKEAAARRQIVVDSLEASARAKDHDISQLQAQLRAAHDNAQSVTQRLEKSQEEASQSNALFAKLEGQLAAARAQAQREQQRAVELELQVSHAQQREEELHSTIATAKQHHDTLSAELTRRGEQLEAAQRSNDELQTLLAFRDDEVKQSGADHHSVKNKLDTALQTVERLENEIVSKSQQHDDLRERLAQHSKTLTSKEQTCLGLTLRNTELQANNTTLQARIDVLESDMDALKRQILDREMRLRDASQARDQVCKEMREKESKMLNAAAVESQLNQRIKDMQRDVEAESQNWAAERNGLQQQVETLRLMCSKLESEVTSLSHDRKHITTALSEHESAGILWRTKFDAESMRAAGLQAGMLVMFDAAQSMLTALCTASLETFDATASTWYTEAAWSFCQADDERRLSLAITEIESVVPFSSSVTTALPWLGSQAATSLDADGLSNRRQHTIATGLSFLATSVALDVRSMRDNAAATRMVSQRDREIFDAKASELAAQVQTLMSSAAALQIENHRLSAAVAEAETVAAQHEAQTAAVQQQLTRLRGQVESLQTEHQHERARHAKYKVAFEEASDKLHKLKAQRAEEIDKLQRALKKASSDREVAVARFDELKRMFIELDNELAASSTRTAKPSNLSGVAATQSAATIARKERTSKLLADDDHSLDVAVSACTDSNVDCFAPTGCDDASNKAQLISERSTNADRPPLCPSRPSDGACRESHVILPLAVAPVSYNAAAPPARDATAVGAESVGKKRSRSVSASQRMSL